MVENIELEVKNDEKDLEYFENMVDMQRKDIIEMFEGTNYSEDLVNYFANAERGLGKHRDGYDEEYMENLKSCIDGGYDLTNIYAAHPVNPCYLLNLAAQSCIADRESKQTIDDILKNALDKATEESLISEMAAMEADMEEQGYR